MLCLVAWSIGLVAVRRHRLRKSGLVGRGLMALPRRTSTVAQLAAARYGPPMSPMTVVLAVKMTARTIVPCWVGR
jgi:hypothetical protein